MVENIFPHRKENILKAVSEYLFCTETFHTESKLCEFCDKCRQLKYPMNSELHFNLLYGGGESIYIIKKFMKMELQV